MKKIDTKKDLNEYDVLCAKRPDAYRFYIFLGEKLHEIPNRPFTEEDLGDGHSVEDVLSSFEFVCFFFNAKYNVDFFDLLKKNLPLSVSCPCQKPTL